MSEFEPWEVGPRIGRYRVIPASPREAAALEKSGKTEFAALSIGRAINGPQIAIIPLDESSREIAYQIVKAHNLEIVGWWRWGRGFREQVWGPTAPIGDRWQPLWTERGQ